MITKLYFAGKMKISAPVLPFPFVSTGNWKLLACVYMSLTLGPVANALSSALGLF